MTSPHLAPPRDVMSVLSAGGRSAVPVEMARSARRRGIRDLFDEAYRERAQRLARAIIQQGNADPEQQEV